MGYENMCMFSPTTRDVSIITSAEKILMGFNSDYSLATVPLSGVNMKWHFEKRCLKML